jgi:hypothetical protein
MKQNRYGLSRHIPEATKKEVRSRCGFGCVICGICIVDYDHFLPEFKDAKSHDPNGITLLCAQHNQEKQRGFLSNQKVIECNQNPKCKQNGFVNYILDVDKEIPDVFLGKAQFINTSCILKIMDEKIFYFSKNEENIFQINFSFFDSSGNEICKIKNNELIHNIGNFDIQVSGGNFAFKDSDNQQALDFKYEPRKSISINFLKMKYKNFTMEFDKSDGLLRTNCINLNLNGSYKDFPTIINCSSRGFGMFYG